MFIPSGRLSAVSREGEKIQIQTEFATSPRARVTTSVVFRGQVVHKEETPWTVDTGTPEGQRELEESLKRQHFAVHTQVEQGAIELRPLASDAETAEVRMPSVPQPAASGTRHPAADTPGVMRLFIVAKNGDVLAADDSGVPGASHTGIFEAAAEFIEFWETSEGERFNQMITRHRDVNFLLVRHFGKYWCAELAPDADPDETMGAFVKALGQ